MFLQLSPTAHWNLRTTNDISQMLEKSNRTDVWWDTNWSRSTDNAWLSFFRLVERFECLFEKGDPRQSLDIVVVHANSRLIGAATPQRAKVQSRLTVQKILNAHITSSLSDPGQDSIKTHILFSSKGQGRKSQHPTVPHGHRQHSLVQL